MGGARPQGNGHSCLSSMPLDWKIKLIKRFQLNAELGMHWPPSPATVIPLKWQINFNKFHSKVKSQLYGQLS